MKKVLLLALLCALLTIACTKKQIVFFFPEVDTANHKSVEQTNK